MNIPIMIPTILPEVHLPTWDFPTTKNLPTRADHRTTYERNDLCVNISTHAKQMNTTEHGTTKQRNYERLQQRYRHMIHGVAEIIKS